MRFDVQALAADNRLHRLSIEASDAAAARAQVQSRGLRPGTVRPAPAVAGWRDISGGRQPRFELMLFSQELCLLLNAGLGIVEALEGLLEKQAQPASRDVLSRLLTSLREGQRFSAALTLQAAVFPPLYVGIIRAAEGTSDLPRALTRFVQYEQRLSAVRTKTVNALIYPAILLGVGAAVTLFLVAYVVPRFAEVYQDTGRSLPWLSQLMLSAGQALSRHALPAGLAALACLVAVAVSLRHAVQTRGAAALLGLLPGMAERVRVFELSRLLLTLGMLIEGGIPVAAALRTMQSVAAPAQGRWLAAALAMIEAGTPLSAALEAQGLSTPISLRLVRVGERTGNLGAMLMQSAAFHDEEVGRWIDRFTRSFEPLLMAFIGLLVGVIVVMLYLPIFDLAGGM